MANKMLIDATHPEETRVVVLRGNRVEEFDFESAQRKQLRGNIYLAKVTRVEPSLQAAFVDYGGNRHGFLAFSEIHPDYYQIPVADRQALIDEDSRAQRAAEDDADRRSRRHRGRGRSHQARRDEEVVRSEPMETSDLEAGDAAHAADATAGEDHSFSETTGENALSGTETGTAESGQVAVEDHRPDAEDHASDDAQHESAAAGHDEPKQTLSDALLPAVTALPEDDVPTADADIDIGDLPTAETVETAPVAEGAEETEEINDTHETAERREPAEHGDDDEAAEEIVESVGGSDALEEVPDRAPRYRRQYKIQEVIKRRQVMLVQVVKEERGTKGAALTTYLSLAGRYSVLMPNTARGGGISRKITSGDDRSRLKEIAQELEVPEGMGVIVRTAGASRTKTEIKRDFEYLLRLWETVRDLTLKSTAPKLVYEEGSLVKRSIRDLYNKDIDEIIVAGQESYQEAKDFMRMLMPSHAKNVKAYSDTQPLLSRYGVENQLDGMFSPVVQLRSGGYIVINQAEALVAIDVNSGRATREHHIEDTALKTNLEASDEIARQLRLRDLAGLIVIDFIDMDENRNNRSVERRLKECLKQDRARIQVGRISHFGLLEMSRQRIRTSVLESSTEKCPHCGGSGHVRSVSSLALQVLRALEDQLMKSATHNLVARTRPDVALYVLNQKRAHLRALEERFAITVTVNADETLIAPQAFVVDRGEQVHTIEAAKALAARTEAAIVPLEEDDDLEDTAALDADDESEISTPEVAIEQTEGGERKRRRRRRRGGRNNGSETPDSQDGHPHQQHHRDDETADAGGDDAGETSGDLADDDLSEENGEAVAGGGQAPQRDGERRRRRRGRRGGRRNRMERDGSPERHDNGQESGPNENQQNGQDEGPQHSFSPDDESGASPRAEAGLSPAVADHDAPRATSPAADPVNAATSPPAAAPPAPAEAPRRRSTVREPAPTAASSDAAPPAATPVEPPPAPAQQPAVAAEAGESETSEGESSGQPRRRGWWSRRIAGG